MSLRTAGLVTYWATDNCVLTRLSTHPSHWPAAGPMKTVLKGRRGHTAMVTVGPAFQCLNGKGGSGGRLGPWVAPECGPGGACVSLFVSSPLSTQPHFRPRDCLVFSRH